MGIVGREDHLEMVGLAEIVGLVGRDRIDQPGHFTVEAPLVEKEAAIAVEIEIIEFAQAAYPVLRDIFPK